MEARIIGEVDALGYLYCAECHPQAIYAGNNNAYPVAIRTDSGYDADPCDMCHRPIGHVVSVKPHAAEHDRWMIHPDDADYLEPEARWCRVCGLPDGNPIHDKTKREV